MLLVLVIIGIISFFAINIYTRKGQTEEVPKLTGLSVKKAIEILESSELDYVISDSVYDKDAPRHQVMEQNPAAMSMVKKGRKIYLTVNSLDVPEVEMPDIAGKMSFNIAKLTLQRKGLLLGKVIEQPDPSIASEADKPVFEQLYRGEPIAPGESIKRGSTIDLVIGVMVNRTDTSGHKLDTVPMNGEPPPKTDGIDY